ncbi:MAG: hypothetical protein K6E97_07910 [Treponema sp.]|nr:hypothetical protein [Treponema sp.]
MIFSLFKILFSNMFSFASFKENFKKGKKGLAKNILIIIAAIYCAVVFTGIFSFSMISVYKTLESNGQLNLMPVSTVLSIVVVNFIFGLLTVISNYCSGKSEEQFLAMPLKPVHLFGAKFAISIVTDGFLSLIMCIIAGTVYGINQHIMWNPLIYIGMLVTGLTISVVITGALYFVLILILLAFPVLRKRSILVGISTVIIILFAWGYGFISSNVSVYAAGVAQKISSASEQIKWVSFFADALIGKPGSILLLLTVDMAVIVGMVPTFAPGYVKSLNGFTDEKSKKISDEKASELIKNDTRQLSQGTALLLRDIKCVFTEPSFLVNGPLIIILLPFLMIVPSLVAVSSKGKLSVVLAAIKDVLINFIGTDYNLFILYSVVIIAGISVLFSSMTNIAGTSFSREGKGFVNLKAMPIKMSDILTAKIRHSMIYFYFVFIVLAIIYIVLTLCIPLPLTVLLLCKIFAISYILSYSAVRIITSVDIMLDLANPKMEWENPVAAFKQNMNVLFSILISWGFIALFALLFVFVVKENVNMLLYIGAVLLIISGFINRLLYKYADKRYSEI